MIRGKPTPRRGKKGWGSTTPLPKQRWGVWVKNGFKARKGSKKKPEKTRTVGGERGAGQANRGGCKTRHVFSSIRRQRDSTHVNKLVKYNRKKEN